MRQPGDQLIDPAKEPTREELRHMPEIPPDFLERTRRYRRLTQGLKRTEFAQGLDSDPKDFA